MEVYADYAATTPMDGAVRKALLEDDGFGNPSSIHRAGKEARAKIEKARRGIAQLLNASSSEIFFTSGATEGNNMAIRGVANQYIRPHIITTEIEHASVLNTLRSLEADVTYLQANADGAIDVDALKNSLRDETVLVSVMLVNNETGVMQPIYEIQEALSEHKALLHIDAVQAYGHMAVDVKELGADLLTLSAHKMYGPKGIGLLYKRKDVKLIPLITGGGQEKDLRGGTENTMWIEGLSLAMQQASDEMTRRSIREMQIKEQFLNLLTQSDIPFEVNGDVNKSASHIINIHFPFAEAEFMLTALDLAGIHASAGSACQAGTLNPSHVLTSMYGESNRNRQSIRFSFSYMMTDEEVEAIVTALEDIYGRLMR
ncbi:cysteine desulfurase family protein [Salinicoccus siamensis]|uniref:Cysteine desulfurase family protein n=1 Tax=Salinicoccus siamensis TaxID=381830 RepID=A0ABV5Z3R1_9STAP